MMAVKKNTKFVIGQNVILTFKEDQLQNVF